eukprot:3640566-Amphidinium_carterae.1
MAGVPPGRSSVSSRTEQSSIGDPIPARPSVLVSSSKTDSLQERVVSCTTLRAARPRSHP